MSFLGWLERLTKNDTRETPGTVKLWESPGKAGGLHWSQEGQELFAAITKENINKRLAIVLDGHLYSAPVIRSEISGGKAQITGPFTEEEAKGLAAKINEAVGSR